MDVLIRTQENDVMESYNNEVDAKDTVTRAHMAKMLVNFLRSMSK